MTSITTVTGLADRYRAYLHCLNDRDWDRLGDFVADDVIHNDRPLGLSGYRAMLIGDTTEIPDLRFETGLLVSQPPLVAARLDFDCTPRGRFLGLEVDGTQVRFSENVFYRFDPAEPGRIRQVWSVIDRAALEGSLLASRGG